MVCVCVCVCICIWLERMELKSYIDGLFARAHCAMCMAIKIVHNAKVCVKCEQKNQNQSNISLRCDRSSVQKNAKNLCHCTLSALRIALESWRFLISLAIEFMVWLTFFFSLICLVNIFHPFIRAMGGFKLFFSFSLLKCVFVYGYSFHSLKNSI